MGRVLRRAVTSSISPSRSCSPTRASTQTRCAASSPRSRRRSPPTRGRAGPGRTTTSAASRHAGPDGDDARARCALMLLLTLRGTPCLYYGDELALTSGDVPDDRILDVAEPSRDPGRTPMPWTRRRRLARSVAASRGHVAQRRGAARRAGLDAPLHSRPHRAAAPAPELRTGVYAELPAPAGSWAWRRGDDVTVVAESRRGPVDARPASTERSRLSTNRSRDGEQVDGESRARARRGRDRQSAARARQRAPPSATARARAPRTTNSRKSGAGLVGRDLNSGWNWLATNHGCSG